MIRRQCAGHCYLITQDDHARASGQLGRCIGNALFAMPSPLESVLLAIGCHDCGWREYDSRPRLNADGAPGHVFELDPRDAPEIWSRTVEMVSSQDSYAGLLASLHVMTLAAFAASRVGEVVSDAGRRTVFLLNRFLHNQVEVQELLRRELDMRIDLPLRRGLAEPGRSPQEDLLSANYHLLRTLDQLSLAACFDELLFDQIESVIPRPGMLSIHLRIGRESSGLFRLDPWPFDRARVEVAFPAKRIADRRYSSEEELWGEMNSAAVESLSAVFQPWQM